MLRWWRLILGTSSRLGATLDGWWLFDTPWKILVQVYIVMGPEEGVYEWDHRCWALDWCYWLGSTYLYHATHSQLINGAQSMAVQWSLWMTPLREIGNVVLRRHIHVQVVWMTSVATSMGHFMA